MFNLDIIDIIIGVALIYVGYRFVWPIILQYGWFIVILFVSISALIGFSLAFSNYIVSLVENMSKR